MNEHPELRIPEPLHALVALRLGLLDLRHLPEVGDAVGAGLGLGVRNHHDRGDDNSGEQVWFGELDFHGDQLCKFF